MAAPNILSATTIYGRSIGSSLDTTLTTDIITCASNKLLKVKTIIIGNTSATDTGGTVYFYDSSTGVRTALAYSVNVPANASLVVLGQESPIYLEEGDQIESGASASSRLQITISYEELDDA
jgi:hypothetical protein